MKKNTAIAIGTAAGFILLLFLAVVLVFVLMPAASQEEPLQPQLLAMNETSPQMPRTDHVPVLEEQPCDFDEWVGSGAGETEEFLKSTGRPYRMIHPGMAVTMDYSPARINAELNDNGIVTRVYCG